MKNTLFVIARSLAIFALFGCSVSMSIPASAANLSWDANGATTGTGGTGNWTSSGLTWNAGANSWSDGSDALFPNTAGTATITGFTPTANSISFTNAAGNYNITGGTLNITSTSQSIIMATNATSTNGQGINSTISGTDITVANNYNGGTNATARTLLNLNSANTFTGSLILGGTGTGTALGNSNQVALGNANGLGGPTNLSTVKFARNFSNLLFTSGGAGGAAAYTASYGNDIDLNSTGSTGANGYTSAIGAAQGGTVITLNGVIKGTGDANLVFTNGLSGGQGKIILANHETYSGSTVMTMASSATTTGIVALGIDNALPTGTTLTLGNVSGAPAGTFDMAGFNQKVAGIATAGTAYSGGITNTGALKTLTISGNVTSSFGVTGANAVSANIGATTITGKPELAASNDNIALKLDSSNTGQLTLIRPAGNSYNGGTTIDGGTLVAANTSNSATGSGAVAIGSGGTLKIGDGVTNGGVNGAVSGSVTDNGSLIFNRPDSISYGTPISGTGNLTQAGGTGGLGTLTLTSANTLSGTTRSAGGTLNVGHSQALQNSTLDMNGADTGAVTFGTANATLGGLSGSRDLAMPTGILSVGNNNNNTSYGGVLSGIGSNLTKVGNGILTLSGKNTYGTAGVTGTTVNAGTLLVNTAGPDSGTGVGDVLVNGGKLGGNGRIGGSVSVTSGNIGAGNSIGTLNIGGSLGLTSGTFDWEYSSGTVTPLTPLAADLTNVLGALNIAAATNLAVANLGTNPFGVFPSPFVNGTRFTVLSYDGALTGTFGNAPLNNNYYNLGGQLWKIKYDDTPLGTVNGGAYTNAVTLTAVPEASTFLVLGLGGVFAFAAVRLGKRMGLNLLKV